MKRNYITYTKQTKWKYTQNKPTSSNYQHIHLDGLIWIPSPHVTLVQVGVGGWGGHWLSDRQSAYGERKTSSLSLCGLPYRSRVILFVCCLCLSSLAHISRAANCRELCTCGGGGRTGGGGCNPIHPWRSLDTVTLACTHIPNNIDPIKANLSLCPVRTRIHINSFYYKIRNFFLWGSISTQTSKPLSGKVLTN